MQAEVLSSSLAFFVQVPDSLVDVGVNGMIRLGKVAWRKKGPSDMFHIVVADRVGENWQQVVDPKL